MTGLVSTSEHVVHAYRSLLDREADAGGVASYQAPEASREVGVRNCFLPREVAAHTTELNVESDTGTIEAGGSVICRKRDLATLRAALTGRVA